MCSRSNGTPSPCKNKMKAELMGSKPTECRCNHQKKKEKKVSKPSSVIWMNVNVKKQFTCILGLKKEHSFRQLCSSILSSTKDCKLPTNHILASIAQNKKICISNQCLLNILSLLKHYNVFYAILSLRKMIAEINKNLP